MTAMTCALLTTAGLLAFSASAAAQVNVAFSCPVGANDPVVDHQVTVLDLPGNVECAILIGNETGATISELTLTAVFPTSTETLVDSAVFPDGVPGWTSAPADYTATFGLLDYLITPAGFIAPAVDTSAQTATWVLSDVPTGTSEQRFKFQLIYASNSVFGNFPAGQHDIVLNTTSGGTDVATDKTVTIAINEGRTPNRVLSGAGQYRDGDPIIGLFRVGENGHVTNPNTWFPIQTNAEMKVYLPWWDGADVKNVDTATFTAGSDVPLIDATTFQVDSMRQSNIGYGYASPPHETITFDPTTTTGGFAAPFTPWTGPAAGNNAQRMLRYDPATNVLTARWGAMGMGTAGTGSDPNNYEIFNLQFRSALNAAVSGNLAVGEKITIHACVVSDQALADLGREPGPGDTAWCSARTLTVGTAIGGGGSITYYGPHRKESSPSSPGGNTSIGGYIRNNSSLTVTQDVVVQMGGIDQADETLRQFSIQARANRGTMAGANLYVSTTASEYGAETMLTDRAVPQTAESDWILCATGDSTAGTVTCSSSDIAALGVDLALIQEVRYELIDFYPSALGHLVEIPLAPYITVSTTSNADARQSINETPPCGAGDVTEVADASMASYGGVVSYDSSFTDGTQVSSQTSSAVELSDRAVIDTCISTGLNAAPGAGYARTSCSALTAASLGSYGQFVMTLRNAGALDNVDAPLSACITLPYGFELDSGNPDPTKPVLRYKPPGATIYQTVPYDQSRFTHTWDAPNRELCVTIAEDLGDPNDTLNTLEPDAAVDFTVRGLLAPGARRDMVTTVNTISAWGPPLCGGYEQLVDADQVNGFQLSLVPAITIAGGVDHDTVGQSAPFCHVISVDNPAYADDGTLTNSNAGSARDSVVYHEIPVGGGGEVANFASADPTDGAAIWLTTMTINSGALGSATTLDVANTDATAGFVKCVDAPAICDGAAADAALAASAKDHTDVTAVAVVFDEVLVTDASPRGQRPNGATPRVDNPFEATICLVDTGSPDGTLFSTSSHFRSSDTVPAAAPTGAFDVLIEADCPSGAPVASDDTTCDLVDDDCDGDLNEDWVYGGDPTTCGVGVCLRDAVWTCDAGVPTETCTPGAPTSADDATCDGVDQNCQGGADEDWAYTGDVATCGEGVCQADTVYACAGGSVTQSCTPGTPDPTALDDECDGFDNNCVGGVDENFVGQSITCGDAQCAVPGTETCVGGVVGDSCGSEPSACAGDVWWSVVLGPDRQPIGAIRCFMDASGAEPVVRCDKDGDTLRVYLDAGGTCGG